MGRIERPPGWILKYQDRIESGAIKVEEILEEENKLRDVPIKISSVTRAINAMGVPITGLRGGTTEREAAVAVPARAREVVEHGNPDPMDRGPEWLQKYRERILQGTITVDEILAEENKRRSAPIKIATVKRALNAMGYPVAGLPKEPGNSAREVEIPEAREAVKSEEKGPGWLQKYRERIMQGTITVDEILAEENKLREQPIKRSSVTRAINALGYPLIGMRKEPSEDKSTAEVLPEPPLVEAKGGPEKGPGWLQKYRERIVQGTITVDEILAEENKLREQPIKRSSVTRAINAMGYPIAGMRFEGKEAAKVVEKPKKGEEAEVVVFASSIGKLSEATAKRFMAIKKSWEEELRKTLPNDHFLNLLLALAKLVEHGKSLTPREPIPRA
jgi:hypothetical protein